MRGGGVGYGFRFGGVCGAKGSFSGLPHEESTGSKRGQHFTSATGEEVPNEGQKVIPVVTEEGRNRKVTWQFAEVQKPLTAVGKICDNDAICVFGKRGGFIRNMANGEMTKFNRKNGIYVLKMWMRSQKGSKDFRGPGEM